MFSSSKDNVHTYEELRMMQALPLDLKVTLTKDRIRGWVKEYGEDKCYVSFSGGKDSTVLLHLVREMYPDIPAVFSNTGLEYPEIQAFAKSFENVQVVTPRMNFKEVITTYGYPFISKEVSEAVMYARKFLDSVRSGGASLTIATNTNNLQQQVGMQVLNRPQPSLIEQGGNKEGKRCYRQLRGIGEYTCPDESVVATPRDRYSKIEGIGAYSERVCRQADGMAQQGHPSADRGYL